jgi:hypothetical protein
MARRSALSGLSLAEINRELRRRQRTVGTLERRRAALLKKVAALDAEIMANGGAAGGRGAWSRAGGGVRTRPKNEVQLLDALKAALKGKTMSVTEAAEAVQKAGYQTSSVNFRTIVNQTLINNLKKGFKRVGRGQYTAT